MFRKTVSSLIVMLLLLASTLAVASKIQPASADGVDWWPMFHHDLNHTGTSTSTGPTTNNTLWNYTTGGQVDSSPAVAGDLVYVGSYDDNVYCLNATNGAVVWTYTTGSYVESSPAVVNGLVYVGSDDGNVYCLNATNGAVVWTYTTGSFVFSSPAVASDFVYVGSSNGHVYCLNATNGAVVWTYTTGWFVYSSPAVVGGLVYVGSLDDSVYCLNATDGTLVWNYTTGGWVWSSPAVVNGVVYVGSEDGNIYAFGPSSANYDVSIEGVIASKSVVGSGYSMGINVTAADVGDSAETFNAIAYANATIIGSENVTLRAGSSTTVAFTWNTTGFAYGNYTISAYALLPPGETNTVDNNFTGGNVIVTIPGDVDGNYRVNDGDVLDILKAFGSTIGMPNYVANCDIDGNGRINMEDVVIALRNFGQHYP